MPIARRTPEKLPDTMSKTNTRKNWKWVLDAVEGGRSISIGPTKEKARTEFVTVEEFARREGVYPTKAVRVDSEKFRASFSSHVMKAELRGQPQEVVRHKSIIGYVVPTDFGLRTTVATTLRLAARGHGRALKEVVETSKLRAEEIVLLRAALQSMNTVLLRLNTYEERTSALERAAAKAGWRLSAV